MPSRTLGHCVGVAPYGHEKIHVDVADLGRREGGEEGGEGVGREGGGRGRGKSRKGGKGGEREEGGEGVRGRRAGKGVRGRRGNGGMKMGKRRGEEFHTITNCLLNYLAALVGNAS